MSAAMVEDVLSRIVDLHGPRIREHMAENNRAPAKISHDVNQVCAAAFNRVAVEYHCTPEEMIDLFTVMFSRPLRHIETLADSFGTQVEPQQRAMEIALAFLDDGQFVRHFIEYFHYFKEKELGSAVEQGYTHWQVYDALRQAAKSVNITVKQTGDLEDREWVTITALFPHVADSAKPSFPFERMYLLHH